MGRKIISLDNGVSIYQKTIKQSNYYLCLNENNVSEYKIYIGFPSANLDEFFDNDIISEMVSVYDKISSLDNGNIVYLLPSIDMDIYKEATSENDDKLYMNLFMKICNMTNSAYKFLNKSDSNKMNQVITIVKQNDMDSKFSSWLELNPNITNYIESIYVNKNINLSKKDIKEEDLENTIIVDPIINDNKFVNRKKNERFRLLVKPTVNQYGFSNMYSVLLGLIFSIFTGLIIGMVLLK